jgi:Flp pilus assembly protein TadG
MKIRNSQEGAAVVEFTLLALLLLIFVFGIIEFGFIWLQSHYIANAAREGARVASKLEDPTSAGDILTIQNAIKDYLRGSVIYSDTKVDECCGSESFIYIETPVLETISDTPAVRINLTVKTAEIWEPVLWDLLNLVPGADLGEVRQIRETALFPMLNN